MKTEGLLVPVVEPGDEVHVRIANGFRVVRRLEKLGGGEKREDCLLDDGLFIGPIVEVVDLKLCLGGVRGDFHFERERFVAGRV